VITIEN